MVMTVGATPKENRVIGALQPRFSLAYVLYLNANWTLKSHPFAELIGLSLARDLFLEALT
jgi:hypothetical protein